MRGGACSVQVVQSLQATECVPVFVQKLNGQAHYVFKRTFKAINNQLSPFLNAVGTGLIERIDEAKVAVNHCVLKGTEGDRTGHVVDFVQGVDSAYQADPGVNGMGATRELVQHFPSLLKVGGFVEHFALEGNRRVCAQYETQRVPATDRFGFNPRIVAYHLLRATVRVLVLLYIGHLDAKAPQPELTEQEAAAWARRCEDQSIKGEGGGG